MLYLHPEPKAEGPIRLTSQDARWEFPEMRGPRIEARYTMILLVRTPKMGPLLFWKPSDTRYLNGCFYKLGVLLSACIMRALLFWGLDWGPVILGSSLRSLWAISCQRSYSRASRPKITPPPRVRIPTLGPNLDTATSQGVGLFKNKIAKCHHEDPSNSRLE